MSDALNYFLDEETVCSEIDFPDTAIDYAFVLKSADWLVILNKWTVNSEEWKSAITYYAGFAYIQESGPILQKALYYNNNEIRLQALFSVYESVKAEIETAVYNKQEKNLTSILNFFSNADMKKIEEELVTNSSDFSLFPELIKLQNLISEFKNS